jgi:cystathionine beta-lyase/cystathionine gamma-synthase
MSKKKEFYKHFDTNVIHAGVEPDPTTGAMLTPIYQTTTYAQESVGHDKGYQYSRSGNPTVSVLEKKLGDLENVSPAVCFSTGMAATTSLFLALLKAGDHIICSNVVYGGTVRVLRQVLNKFDVSVSFVEATEINQIKKEINSNTKLIFIETPANPTMKLVDIEAVSEISKAHNIPLAVDNTFLTAALQRPFELGADIVLYSTTKYIEGHNSTVGGALLSNNEKYVEEFRFVQNATGNIMSPFPAWLTLQGIKTLSLRIKQHSLNALQVAEYLESHPKIENVAFPGLKSFPQYELAKKQQSDFGGMLCFEVKGGFENGIKLLNSTTLCTLAENLGVIETLITHPASMTHAPIPKEDRLKIGITEGLVRLSVGLEDVRDIIEDLDNALALI